MISHFKALNGNAPDKGKLSHFHKISLIVLNVFLIAVAIFASQVYSGFVKQNQAKTRVDSFVSTIESMKQVTQNYLDTEKGYVNNWAHYIQQKKMDMHGAI